MTARNRRESSGEGEDGATHRTTDVRNGSHVVGRSGSIIAYLQELCQTRPLARKFSEIKRLEDHSPLAIVMRGEGEIVVEMLEDMLTGQPA